MSDINFLEVFNSFTTFAILFAIAVGVWFLVSKSTKSSSRRSRR